MNSLIPSRGVHALLREPIKYLPVDVCKYVLLPYLKPIRATCAVCQKACKIPWEEKLKLCDHHRTADYRTLCGLGKEFSFYPNSEKGEDIYQFMVTVKPKNDIYGSYKEWKREQNDARRSTHKHIKKLRSCLTLSYN